MNLTLAKTTKISIELASILLNCTPRTVYNKLAKGELKSLYPEDVRECLASQLTKKRKLRPRGKPFAKGYDPRKFNT